MLKGGTGMVIRMPGARYSQDVDLMHPADGLDARWAVAQLRTAVQVDLGDHLTFVVDDPVRQIDEHTMARIAVTGYTGATRFDRFSVDLSGRSKLIGDLEHVRPDPVIDLPGMTAMPRVTLYPLPDQVADKASPLTFATSTPP